MTQSDLDQINEWMGNPENMKKLTPLELAKVNLCLQQYMEAIAPIIMRAMNRDDKTTFLFKL